ncbi:molybdenum ABC transporter substrate-binding protein [Moorella thermoacetica]|uniref:Molybdate-binding protein ModA n=1 Tax=Moorella thermoacetica (strain ATCC 39073 / JCM 9320) TaxID=264732 RepID=Q2RHG5_MOOTA|nr:molybdate ABC transporter substrate-binding protein [Moorella thermoacetica]AKX94636.1 molybdate-binding periplasmic protein precursor [Moorella thermoacetica]AKX97271.1 molybdate-binding periplasmic protein precursor [Moorella thermoacetica]OIQ57310.1 molybdate-binding periplasmic protein precursor [Moorella thermoacetica]QDA01100.1 Molybdate-binding periplasmic protein precursor [Moorella thermoacetica]TYL10258.1 Molybdate-binding protein ModA [Moorella thermoacetica]
MKLRRASILIASTLIAALALAGCRQVATPQPRQQGQQPGGQLVVFAAASLTDAFGEIGRAFEKSHPGVTVKFNFGGSQQLRTQIEQGMSADVFASANQKYMQELVAKGLVEPPRDFTANTLTVIVPKNNPAGIKSAADLANKGKLVLAAPDVPIGKYSRQALEKLATLYGSDYPKQVEKRVVSQETTVRQVVAKVALGEADAGIVYVTDINSSYRDKLDTIPFPQEANVRATYPIAVVKDSKQAGLARELVNLILSPDGQKILAKYGFLPVKEGS